jgi:hypothetical protein
MQKSPHKNLTSPPGRRQCNALKGWPWIGAECTLSAPSTRRCRKTLRLFFPSFTRSNSTRKPRACCFSAECLLLSFWSAVARNTPATRERSRRPVPSGCCQLVHAHGCRWCCAFAVKERSTPWCDHLWIKQVRAVNTQSSLKCRRRVTNPASGFDASCQREITSVLWSLHVTGWGNVGFLFTS